LLFLALGIACGEAWDALALWEQALAGALVLGGLGVAAYWQSRSTRLVWGRMVAVGFWLAFGLLGYARMQSTEVTRDAHHFLHYQEAATHWLVHLREPLETRATSYRAEAEVLLAVDSLGEGHAVHGKALLYFKGKAAQDSLRPGIRLLCPAVLQPPEAPRNPHAFDYGAYLRRQGIHATGFVDSAEWLAIGYEAPSSYQQWICGLRRQLTQWLDEALPKGPERAVAHALLLGDRNALDQSIRQSFAAAGAMHVLAVSGLHVGIVYWVFNLLLAFLNRRPLVKVVCLVLLIGLYAVLTGLSDSVTRAATMFTFISLGQLLRKPTNIYNSLAASAFVLLLIDPLHLFRVGFQLSYAAVLGIVWVQPALRERWEPPYAPLRWVRDMTTVSLGAQLGTLLLVVHYFHQLPVYGLFSNLIVIPLGTLALYSGSIYFLLKALPVPALGLWSGAWLETILQALLTTVDAFGQAPGALLRFIYLTPVQMMGLGGLLAGLLLTLVWRQPHGKPLMVLGMLVLALASLHQRYTTQREGELILYAHRRGPLAGWFPGKEAYLLGSRETLARPQTLSFDLSGHWNAMGFDQNALQPQALDTAFERGGAATAAGILQVADKRILVVGEMGLPAVDSVLLHQSQADVVWLCRGVDAFPFAEAARRQRPPVLVLDLSLPPWEYQPMRDSLATYPQLPIHDMRRRGALRWRIERQTL
jgi:competence protein ComEC